MSETHHGRDYIYSIQHHLVWYVRYRHDALYDQIDIDVKQFLKQIADDNNIKIIEIESGESHVHLLIEYIPQHYILSIVKIFKGVPARLLFKKYPELKQLPWSRHLRNPNYFVATVNENTGEQIRKYIQNQKKK